MQHENTCVYMYTHPGWTSTTLKWNQPASARWRLIRKMKTGNFMSVETIAFLGKYYFNFPTWIQQVFGQEAMQHQRGKANGGIAWGEFFLIWVHGHRKWACGCLMWFLLGMVHTPKDLQNTRCTKCVDGCLLIQTASQWQGPVLLNASSKNACYTTELNITPEKWWLKENPFPLGPSNFSGSSC